MRGSMFQNKKSTKWANKFMFRNNTSMMVLKINNLSQLRLCSKIKITLSNYLKRKKLIIQIKQISKEHLKDVPKTSLGVPLEILCCLSSDISKWIARYVNIFLLVELLVFQFNWNFYRNMYASIAIFTT